MRRIIYIVLQLLLLMVFSASSPAQAQSKDATEETKKANAALLKSLPFSDKQSFEDAERGFIAPLPNDGVLKNADGRVIWNLKTWDFIDDKAPAPDTVNPSLWRQAQLLKKSGLFKVTDEIYQVRGQDLANMTFIEGPDGIIVMDPLMNDETAKAAMDLYVQHRPRKPIVAIIVTHSHIDHFGGLGAVVDVAEKDVKIVAPEGFTEASVAENILGGNLQTRRVSYQYGNLIEPGPKGMMTTGLGLTTPTGTVSFRQPTDIIRKDGQKLNLGGLDFEFLLAQGTEAPAELFYYIPALKAASLAEDAVQNQHNVYSLRGAKLRDPLKWSRAIKKARDRWSGKIESLHAPHHWPVWGAESIDTFLEAQSAVYKYIHDQTLRLANHGYTMIEAAEEIELPPSLAEKWYARGYYGTVNHNVKATFAKNFGWYDGNPATLHRLPRKEAGKRYVEAMGGAGNVMKTAQKAYDNGDYRWVVEVLSHVVFSDPGNQKARNLAADAHEQLGYQAEAGTWRNWYLTAAKELREGVKEGNTPNMGSPDIISNMELGLFFDYLGVRLNAGKVGDREMAFNFRFPDTKENYLLKIKHGVLDYWPDVQDKSANATVELNRSTLNEIILGGITLDKAIADGKMKISGDKATFGQFIGFLDEFQPWYGLATP